MISELVDLIEKLWKNVISPSYIIRLIVWSQRYIVSNIHIADNVSRFFSVSLGICEFIV